MRDNDNDTWYENLFKNLDQRCYNCNGSGKSRTSDQPQTRSVCVLTGADHESAEDCSTHRHRIESIPINECDVCYGTGYQPTRAGVELLNFLRRQRKRIEREEGLRR